MTAYHSCNWRTFLGKLLTVSTQHVLIVGAGIVGASIAWHLARSGTQVTVVEAGRSAGGVATRNSWAWINASHADSESYFRLRLQAMAEWHRLERELDQVRAAWTGALVWELAPEELEKFAVERIAWGYDVRRVGRDEIRRIEPVLAKPPEFALHLPSEGGVDPQSATSALLGAAQALGTRLVTNNQVRALQLHDARITGVETELGDMAADHVVVAAGVETEALLATVGLALPIASPPALLLVSRPHDKLLNGLVMTPEVYLRQMSDGRLMAAADFEEGDHDEAAADLFRLMQEMIDSSKSIRVDYHAVTRRPTPLDGLPVLGGVSGLSGLYVAVMHSGITLAPLLGRLAADEINSGKENELLKAYRPERFTRTPTTPVAAGLATIRSKSPD